LTSQRSYKPIPQRLSDYGRRSEAGVEEKERRREKSEGSGDGKSGEVE